MATDDTTLIFLDDTALVSRRAESLTLAAMGRAHVLHRFPYE